MSLKAGIVGLPNVGKSTLFNAVSISAKAQAATIVFVPLSQILVWWMCRMSD